MTTFEDNLSGDVARVVARCGGDSISFKASELEKLLSTDIQTVQQSILRQLPADFIAVLGLDSITFGRRELVRSNSFQTKVSVDPPRR